MGPEKKLFVCCICGRVQKGWGNNPEGAMWKTESGDLKEFVGKEDDRCCDKCNENYVIPGRLYKLINAREAK